MTGTVRFFVCFLGSGSKDHGLQSKSRGRAGKGKKRIKEKLAMKEKYPLPFPTAMRSPPSATVCQVDQARYRPPATVRQMDGMTLEWIVTKSCERLG